MANASPRELPSEWRRRARQAAMIRKIEGIAGTIAHIFDCRRVEQQAETAIRNEVSRAREIMDCIGFPIFCPLTIAL